MRDHEFVAAMLKLATLLKKKFHFLVKRAGVNDDRKSLVEDLVALTILQALVNSRKEIHEKTSCEQLIKMKASNVWVEYCTQRHNSFNHADHGDITLEWGEPQPDANAELNEKLEDLLSKANSISANFIRKRLEGFEVKEIAKMYSTTPGAITMHIQRLKNKIQSRR